MRGQDNLTSRLLIALLCDGRVLVEGVPRPAKTLAIKSLPALLGADFQGIQSTAELLAAGLTGTEMFRPENATFLFRQGLLRTPWCRTSLLHCRRRNWIAF